MIRLPVDAPPDTEDTFRILHAGFQNHDVAFAVEYGDTIDVFTGPRFRPSFMLILRRRSPELANLDRLVGRLPTEHLRDMLAGFMAMDEAHDWDRDPWFGTSLEDQVEEAIQRGDVHIYRFGASERARLLDPEDPLFSAPGAGRPSGHERGAAALLASREQLANELGGTLVARWRRKDAFDATLHRESAAMQAWLHLGALGAGGADALSAAASGIEATWEMTVDAVSALDDAVVATYRSTSGFVSDISEHGWAGIQQAVTDIGLAVGGGLKRLKALVAEGYIIYETLLNDPATRQLLADFSIGWLESVPDIHWARLAGRVVTTVAVEALVALALAVASGGAGAIANIGRRLGQFTTDAIELMADIYHHLTRARRSAEPENAAIPKSTFERHATDTDRSTPTDEIPTSLTARQSSRPEGLHNEEWEDIEVRDFKTRREIDLNNLSPADQEAAERLEEQGRSEYEIEKLLSSGRNLEQRQLKEGEVVYGFDTAQRAKTKDPSSMFWLDEAGYQDVKRKFFDNGVWDREAVKNYLALPCFNRANVIDTALVQKTHSATESTIGKATEQVGYTRSPHRTGLLGKIMAGGGQQVTPDPAALSDVVRLGSTP